MKHWKLDQSQKPYTAIRLPIIIALGLLLTLFNYSSLAAQTAGLVTEDLQGSLTAEDLVESLKGSGVTINSVTYAGADASAGKFSGGTDIIGFDSGIILSTGKVNGVVGPNNKAGFGEDVGAEGDAELTALAGQPTEDAAVLTIDFTPDGDQVFFRFVFSSEEYPEYVDDKNDVFAFFVNGTNCALINGTPVSINDVNKDDNADSFRSNPVNSNTINTQMDGLTTGLTCEATVNAGASNTLKLAIADAGDGVYDSNVFIEAGTFSTEAPPAPEPEPEPEPAVESCIPLPLRMNSWGDVHITSPDGLTYDFQEVGDYLLSQSLSGEVVIQSRQTTFEKNTNVSINTASAMYVAGDVVEFYALPDRTIFINGENVGLPRADIQLSNGGILRVVEPPNVSANAYSIVWPGGHTEAKVIVHLTPHIDIGMARLDCSQTYEGLLGNLDLRLENDMTIRGGEVIVPPATVDQLIQFGISWEIGAGTSLFTAYEPPVSEPSTTGGTLFTIWDINPLDRLRATNVCKDAGISDPVAFANCVYDVGITGNTAFVGSAKAFEWSLPSLDILIDLGLKVEDFTGIGIDVERLKLDYGIDIAGGIDADIDISGVIPPLNSKVIAVTVTEQVSDWRGRLTVDGEIAVRDLTGTFRYFKLVGDPSIASGTVDVQLCPALDVTTSVDVFDIITVEQAGEENLTAANLPCSGVTPLIDRIPFIGTILTNPLWVLVIGLVFGMIICRILSSFGRKK